MTDSRYTILNLFIIIQFFPIALLLAQFMDKASLLKVLERLVTSHDETLGHEVMTILGSISCGGLAGNILSLSAFSVFLSRCLSLLFVSLYPSLSIYSSIH